MRLLLVDDNAVTLMMLNEVLPRWGYKRTDEALYPAKQQRRNQVEATP